MTENILPVPKTVLEKLLKPISRISESCILNISNDVLYTICSTSDNSVFLYGKTKLPVECGDSKLNVINIKKLLTGLNCLGDGGEFSMVINTNHIECRTKSQDIGENCHFKYHLVDDGIIKECSLNIKKISLLQFDTEFLISQEKIKKIINAYSFVSDVSKIYFYSKDGKINCEIDDKTMQNVDNLSMVLTDNFIGDDIHHPTPVNIEIFKLLIASKSPVKVKLNNEHKVFVFQTQDDDNLELKYIVSALVK